MMVVSLALSVGAFAGDDAAAPLDAGEIIALGLDAPTRIEGSGLVWRYPLVGRGVVTVSRFADAAAAGAAFDGWLRTGATRWPATVAPTFPVDRSAGDGVAIQLALRGNVVVMVRDAGGEAGRVTEQVLAAVGA